MTNSLVVVYHGPVIVPPSQSNYDEVVLLDIHACLWVGMSHSQCLCTSKACIVACSEESAKAYAAKAAGAHRVDSVSLPTGDVHCGLDNPASKQRVK